MPCKHSKASDNLIYSGMKFAKVSSYGYIYMKVSKKRCFFKNFMFFTELRQSYAMRNLLYIFTTLLILSSCQKNVVLTDENPLFSQRENCEQTDEVKEMYEKDAAKLALELMKHDGVNTSDVQIPADYYQKSMDALMVIYNATKMEARDAVIEVYDIHAIDAPKRFMINLDTAYPWTKNWIHGESKTNNKTIT